MSYTGRVHNGVVVIDNGAELAEGTIVRIEPMGGGVRDAKRGHTSLMKLAGSAKGLPTDLARNHDHYLHGQPKR